MRATPPLMLRLLSAVVAFGAACQPVVPPLSATPGPQGALVSPAGASPVANGPALSAAGADVLVTVAYGKAGFQTKARQARVGDVANLRYRIFATTDLTTALAAFDTTATSCLFKKVPDGTYRIKVEAFNGATAPITQTNPGVLPPVLGAVVSSNIATVSNGSVTYGAPGGALRVTVTLKDATGETISGNTATITDGAPWTGTPTSRPVTFSERYAHVNLFEDGYASGPLVVVPGVGVITYAERRGLLAQYDEASTVWTVLAGRDGDLSYSGDGGRATNATIGDCYGLARATDGTLYFSDGVNHVVRRIDTAGVIDVYAGQPGTRGRDGDGRPANAAHLNNPQQLALSGSYLYVLDRDNNTVRRIDLTTGTITLLAGNADGVSATDGDGGDADRAHLEEPMAIALAGTQYLYVVQANSKIRRVDLLASPPQIETPLDMGRLKPNGPAAIGPDGQLYVAVDDFTLVACNLNNLSVKIVAGQSTKQGQPRNGERADTALDLLQGLGFDSYGRLYLSQRGYGSPYRLSW
ncbi:MAG: hypothetical protein H7338_20240 [Candidatus Sericytochromatia bacterium]|nr:hypothetical protein [Candidatus Sericytochromatia bacterium]